ncbi:MAG: hypothetical protein ABIK65_13935 [Candidatus Eisenbacteria bacterium]
MARTGFAARMLPLVAVLFILAPPPPPAAGQEPCEDRIQATSSGDSIVVVHAGAYYNCCVVIEAVLELPEPFLLEFLETETYPIGPCFCMCCIDVTMEGAGFAPGLYTVRVWNEDRSVLFGETEVEVSSGGRDDPGPLTTTQSDCLDVVSVPEPPVLTWGRIKTFFR